MTRALILFAMLLSGCSLVCKRVSSTRPVDTSSYGPAGCWDDLLCPNGHHRPDTRRPSERRFIATIDALKAEHAAAVERLEAQHREEVAEATSDAIAAMSHSLAERDAECARLRSGLERIREMMSPKNRQQFVMHGPLAFVGVYNEVCGALDATKPADSE